VLAVPMEENTLSFFRITEMPQPATQVWHRIKEALKNSGWGVNLPDCDNAYVAGITLLKDHIPLARCGDRELCRHLAARQTCRDITAFATAIEGILQDDELSPDAGYLLQKLARTDRPEEYLEKYRDLLRYPDPVGYLQRKRREKGLSLAKIGARSGQHDYVYKIFKGEREPKRDVIISIAVGMELNPDETQKLLRLFRLAELSLTDGRDAIILFGILKNKTVWEIDDMLHRNHKSTLSKKLDS
ncbi:MAG: helix-turn-helix transcriptional regulator, partial [Clostridia bacterium]|nr:helix-turn-helix transcriptional regulator [Clostridia bacterium]